MELTGLFLLELAFLAVLVAALGVGAIIAFRRERAAERQEEAGERTESGVRDAEPPRELYKSLGPERGTDAKIRLYSPTEYERELGGDADAMRSGGFVAALKVFRRFEARWYEVPLDKAAHALELKPEEHEPDTECGVLLARKLPPGFPTSAKDRL